MMGLYEPSTVAQWAWPPPLSKVFDEFGANECPAVTAFCCLTHLVPSQFTFSAATAKERHCEAIVLTDHVLGPEPGSAQFSTVTQLCPALCDPKDCSKPGFPVHYQLLELAQTHVHRVWTPSNPLILCHPLLLMLQSFPASGSFPVSQFFASGGQSIGVSASTSVPPMNTQ